MIQISENLGSKELKIQSSDSLLDARKIYLSENNVTIKLEGEFDIEYLEEFSEVFFDLQKISLFIYNCPEMFFLYKLKMLEELNFTTLYSTIDFNQIRHIKKLTIGFCHDKFLLNLDCQEKLEYFYAFQLSKKNIEKISNIKSLKKIKLESPKLINFDEFNAMPNLIALYIKNSRSLENLVKVNKLSSLQYLCLNECSKVLRLKPIEELGLLKSLELINCKNITDWEQIQFPNSLLQLSILGSSNKLLKKINIPSNLVYACGNLGGDFNVSRIDAQTEKITFNNII